MRALKDLERQAGCPGAGARPGLTFYNKEAGGMGEWLKPAVLKTVYGETRSGVRIPLPPPLPSCPNSLFGPRVWLSICSLIHHEYELAVRPGSAPAGSALQAADVCNPADLVGPYAFQLTGSKKHFLGGLHLRLNGCLSWSALDAIAEFLEFSNHATRAIAFRFGADRRTTLLVVNAFR